MTRNKIIAREWLIFIFCILVGVLYTLLFHFRESSSDYSAVRKTIYADITAQRQRTDQQRIKLLYYLPSSLPHSFEPIIDTSVHIGSFETFSKRLDDATGRRIFYDSISARFDLGDFKLFESKVVPPSMLSGFSTFCTHLFSRSFWLFTWILILLPYFALQFLRSILLSINILLRK